MMLLENERESKALSTYFCFAVICSALLLSSPPVVCCSISASKPAICRCVRGCVLHINSSSRHPEMGTPQPALAMILTPVSSKT
ncbi:hypothetical protein BJ878DRAFT_213452 [Calycina marina]|uniref:Uncharacterized protein n=1 Tax=Calycina marina TaxID=1763456 RepID=A0A9P8CHV4_9HELO|nr:hypothetical protein BJ878DRAFT_213452 [Calycina marina]